MSSTRAPPSVSEPDALVIDGTQLMELPARRRHAMLKLPRVLICTGMLLASLPMKIVSGPNVAVLGKPFCVEDLEAALDWLRDAPSASSSSDLVASVLQQAAIPSVRSDPSDRLSRDPIIGAMPDRIDLRSDTVTRPTEGMRRAIAEAEVGDDQYGEDPSVNRLQDEVASLLGMEASLFLPSGTMANQVALRTLTRPGDDVLVPTDVAHRHPSGRRRRRERRRPVQPHRERRHLRRRCGARGDQASRAHRLPADVAAHCGEHPQPCRRDRLSGRVRWPPP